MPELSFLEIGKRILNLDGVPVAASSAHSASVRAANPQSARNPYEGKMTMALPQDGANERLATNGPEARRMRRAAGLTQHEAYLASGEKVSTRTISDIERGIGASANTLRIYAAALGPTVDWHDFLTKEEREKLSVHIPASDAPVVPNPSAEGILVHSHSGRWNLIVTFQRWRGRALVAGESVVVNGHMDLWIPMNGRAGVGVAMGHLQLRLLHPPKDRRKPYASTILVVDEIDQVRCSSKSVCFRSKTFSRFVDTEDGERPSQDGVAPRLPNGTFFSWSLVTDDSTPDTLNGQYAIIGDERDAATVIATRP